MSEQHRLPYLPLIVAEGANPIGSAMPLHCSIGLRMISDSSDKLLERSALMGQQRTQKPDHQQHPWWGSASKSCSLLA